MTSQLDYLFNEPKWQARLVDESKFFLCQDGTKISSLWELRQVLINANDETLNAMVSENYNYIAPWVADALGDSTLAADLQARKDRWGLVAALESNMIRSLALPSYLASKWLTYSITPFNTSDGMVVNNLVEASKILENEEKNGLSEHLGQRKHDFAEWVRHSVGNYMLADMVEDADNGEKAIGVIKGHVKMLEAASWTNCDGCECGECKH